MRLALSAALAVTLTAGAHQAPASSLDVWLERHGLAPRENVMCGIPPIPPIGCRVGACVCDQNGLNCRWTFVCG